MGVVLPHGGIVLRQFAEPDLRWFGANIRLGESLAELGAEFAKPRNLAGYLARGSLMLPLVLVAAANGGVEWRLRVDGVRPQGLPNYYITKRTAEALQKAEQASADEVQIEGNRYRLHAACIDGVHLAVLARVEP